MYEYNYDHTFLKCLRFLNNPQKGSSSSFDKSIKKGLIIKNKGINPKSVKKAIQEGPKKILCNIIKKNIVK